MNILRKITCTLSFLLGICFLAHSQYSINKKKEGVLRLIAINSKHYQTSINQTDSIITYKVLGPVKPCQMIMHFDQSGKCDSEETIYECEECYTAQVKKILKSHWTMIDDTRYIKGKMELILQYQNQPYAYIFKRIQ